MITWVLYLCIGVVIGGMAGFYFAKLDDFSKKQKLELEEKLQQSERELISYKDEVTSHFMKTADLINDMTESYQKVHEHLAHGSVELCNNAIEVNKLTVSTDQLLTTPSTAPSIKSPDDEVITSSADSEAPKSYTNNNNNKENTSTSHAEVAESNDQESKSSTDPTVASAIASETSAATSSTQSQSTQPHIEQPSADNPATQNPVDVKENSQENKQTSESTTPDAPTSPILETMAVAEEDEPTSKSEKKPKSRIPGNRIVH